MKKLIIFALVGVMSMNPQPVRSAPLVIGGILVAIGAGIIGCRAIKRCQKIAAGRTNAWPEEIGFNVAAGDPTSYAAAYFWSEDGYCVEERLTTPRVPVAFTLDIYVESATNAITTMSAKAGSEHVRSWDDFMATEMPALGFREPTFGELPSAQYSRNGHPCDVELVPVSFSFETRTATIGNGGVTVTVYRSEDLNAWETMMSLNVPVGSRLEVADATSDGQAFYRVTTK